MTDLKLKLSIDTREANRAIESVHNLATQEFKDLKQESLEAETAYQMTEAIKKLDSMVAHAKGRIAETKEALQALDLEWKRRSEAIADRVKKEFETGKMNLTASDIARGIHSFKDKYGTENIQEAVDRAQLNELEELENKIIDCMNAQERYNQEVSDAEKLRGAMTRKEKSLLQYTGNGTE